MEVGFEYRLDYQLDRSLYNPVLYGRDAKRPKLSVRLLNVRPFHRTGPVGLVLEFPSDSSEEALDPFRVMLDLPKRHPVGSWRSFVGAHGFVGAFQHILPQQLPIQAVESVLWLLLCLP